MAKHRQEQRPAELSGFVADDILPDLLRGNAAARRRAVEVLYLRCGGRIRNYYRQHGASASDAEDWLHETFVRVLRSLDSLRDDSRLAAWMWRTARNVMIDALRSTSRLRVVNDERPEALHDDGDGPMETLQRTKTDECVRQAFDRFALRYPEGAQCLVWAAVDGLTMQEISELIGRSVGATREFISQCRKKLRPYLAPCFASLTEHDPLATKGAEDMGGRRPPAAMSRPLHDPQGSPTVMR